MEDKKRVKNAKLFVRIFPSMNMSHEDVKISDDLKTLQIRSLQDFLPRRKRIVSNESRFLSFETDGIFCNVSQDEIYDKVMGSEIVENVFTGMNAVVLGYGQTGTGKSFTINGMRNVYECRGLAPRLISELFNVRNNKKREIHVSFEISFIEIIGKQINDLLRTKPKTHTFGNDLKNVTIYPLNSEKHGLEMLFNGEGRRICENAPYFGANRAHSVMTIYITSQNMLYSMSPVRYGKIHLVDLAGIDSVGKETSAWKRGWDIGQANLTKSFLEQYLTKTNTKNQVIMNDPLIQYLGSVENCAMRFVAHISAALPDLELTLSTLKFGANVSGMKFAKIAVSNKEKQVERVDTGLDRIRYISEQLELSAMLFDQPDYAVTETKLCPARLGHLRRLAESYIRGETSELQLMSVVQSTVSMKVFKEIYDKLIEERQPVVKELELLEKTVQGERNVEKIVSQGSVRLAEKKKKHSSGSTSLKKKRNSSNLRKKKESLVDSSLSMTARPKKTSKKSLKKNSKTTVDSKPISAAMLEKPSEPVREIDQFGITIGPGIVTHYEGAYTQAEKKLRAQLAKDLNNEDATVDDRTVVIDDDICNAYRFINIVEEPAKTEELVIKVERKESLLSEQLKDASNKRTSNGQAKKSSVPDKKGGKKAGDKKGKSTPGTVSPKDSVPSLARDKLATKLANIPDSNIPETLPVLPPTPAPSLDPTWELFLQSGIKENLQEELNQAESNGRETHRVYLKLMEDLQQCRRVLTETRHQLEETQHKRHLSGEERYDADGRVLTSEEEAELMKSVRERETEMNAIKATLVRQRIVLNESLYNVDRAKRTLDDAYAQFRASLNDGRESTERASDAVRQTFDCEVDPRMIHYNYLRDTRLGFAHEGTKLYGK